uniref:Putative secreted peptide n=1 Tax=Anopheles braziliensis TaxID=58242 RepID=A0A2M3ZPA7_9DIPT
MLLLLLLLLTSSRLARQLLVLFGLFRFLFRWRRNRHRCADLAYTCRAAKRGAATATNTNTTSGAAWTGVDIVVTIVTKADAIDLIGRTVPHLMVLVAIVQGAFAVVHHLQVGAARIKILDRVRIGDAVNCLPAHTDTVERGGATGT